LKGYFAETKREGSGTSVDDTFADGVEDEFGGSMEAELFESVAAMSIDSVGTDVERGSDFLVGLAFGE